MIKRYICILAVLFGTMGYGQGIDGSKSVTVKYSFSTGENKLIVTVAVADFLQTMPVQLYTPPPITAPTINIQEILNNPSSSEEDKAKAHEALAIQQAQEAQAAAAMAQMQSLIAWLEAQSQALAQSQAQTQAQAQAQAEAFLGSLQQVSQSIANGGTVNTNTNTNTNTTVTWYFDNDGDGYHSNTANTKIMSAPGWKTSTSGLDCDDNDPARTSNCTANLPTIPWFLDNDNDGYFAIVQPGTRKPTTPGNWTSVMTKGPDCDDTNPAIGICSAMPSLLNYYIDYDGDGYDSGTITSTTSLGAPYKTSTKGKDCNDNIYSADNSVCSVVGAVTPDPTPKTKWYWDGDRDTYVDGATVPKEAETSPGAGWVKVTDGKDFDCDDTDPLIGNCKMESKDCTTDANTRGADTTTLLNSPVLQMPLAQFRDTANLATGKPESGMSIEKLPNGTLVPYNYQLATGTVSNATVATQATGKTIVAGVHTHTGGKEAGPSPQDIYHLMEGYKGNNYYKTDFNIAANGNEYALVVENSANLVAFETAYPSSTNINPATNDFLGVAGEDKLPGLNSLKEHYDLIASTVLQQGYNIKEVPEITLIIMLDHYSTGIKLLKKEKDTSDFKELSFSTEIDAQGKTKLKIERCK